MLHGSGNEETSSRSPVARRVRRLARGARSLVFESRAAETKRCHLARGPRLRRAIDHDVRLARGLNLASFGAELLRGKRVAERDPSRGRPADWTRARLRYITVTASRTGSTSSQASLVWWKALRVRCTRRLDGSVTVSGPWCSAIGRAFGPFSAECDRERQRVRMCARAGRRIRDARGTCRPKSPPVKFRSCLARAGGGSCAVEASLVASTTMVARRWILARGSVVAQARWRKCGLLARAIRVFGNE